MAVGAPRRIKGFLDSRSNILDGFDYGTSILGPPEHYLPESSDIFLCAIGDPQGKPHYTAMLEERGAEFISMIHPTALVGHNVRIGAGAIICPLTQLFCDIELGRHVVFGTFSSGAHDFRIGNFSQISGGCQINGQATLG